MQMNRYDYLPSYHYEDITLNGGVGQISPASPEMRKIEIYGAVHKNLIKYPYLHNGDTINGVTFTTNENGGILAQGTATADIEYEVQTVTDFTRTGWHRLSGCPSGGSSTTFYLAAYDSATTSSTDTGSGISINVTASTALTIKICIKSGVTIYQIFYPQLEVGTSATTYSRYEEQLLGQRTPNLFYWAFDDKTEKGLTYKVNKDNPCEITITGTTTEAVNDTIIFKNISANQYYGFATSLPENSGVRLSVGSTIITSYKDAERFSTNSLPTSPLKLVISKGTTVNVTFKICVVTLESIEWDFKKIDDSSVTKSGITFTYNNNGSITLNGTYTGTSDDYYICRCLLETNLKSTLNLQDHVTTAMLVSTENGFDEVDYTNQKLNVTARWSVAVNGKFVYKNAENNGSAGISYFELVIGVKVGATFDNYIVFPRLFWMPAGIEGKGLYDYGYETMIQTCTQEEAELSITPIDNTTQTINGVTFTVNSDNSVTVNGTATQDTEFLLKKITAEATWPMSYITIGNANKSANNNYALLRWEYGRADTGETIYNRQTPTTTALTAIRTQSSAIPYEYRVKIKVLANHAIDNITFRPTLKRRWIGERNLTLKLSQKKLSAKDILEDKSIYNLFKGKINNISVYSNYNNLANLSSSWSNGSIKYDALSRTYTYSGNYYNSYTSDLNFSQLFPTNSDFGSSVYFAKLIPLSDFTEGATLSPLATVAPYMFSEYVIADYVGSDRFFNITETKNYANIRRYSKDILVTLPAINFYNPNTVITNFKFKFYVTPIVKGVYSNVYNMDNPVTVSDKVIVQYYKC